MLYEQTGHKCKLVVKPKTLWIFGMPLFGPSGLRAPVVQTLRGHYFGNFFHFFLLLPLNPEGGVVGFKIFAWAPK